MGSELLDGGLNTLAGVLFSHEVRSLPLAWFPSGTQASLAGPSRIERSTPRDGAFQLADELTVLYPAPPAPDNSCG